MKKMMFNERYGLESAVITGSKTMTRRDAEKVRLTYEVYRGIGEILSFNGVKETLEQFAIRKSPFKVGDVVAVMQGYKTMGYDPMFCPPGHEFGLGSEMGWSNKMYVSADLCKHHIKITEVRFELLQTISAEECLKEGIIKTDCCAPYGYRDGAHLTRNFRTPIDAFASLIDKVSGKGTWERNPYVYVYSFTLID